MSHWNYRVIHRKYPVPESMRAVVGHDWDDNYAVHEVYYDEAGEPKSCTTNPVGIEADNMPDLHATKALYVQALLRPVLEWDMFGEDEEQQEVSA